MLIALAAVGSLPAAHQPVRFEASAPPAPATNASAGAGDCPVFITGDVNVSGSVNSADIIYMVNWVFKGGLALLPCTAAGDVNCNGAVTSADVIYLCGYVFQSGAPPCDACTSPLAVVC